ncbi:hypothetical protein EVAR_76083_1 [Eumeta japonica]|uniref:Uncharacterized protein n=1 Tax=Eumeta variegata TaxID=151549 RepID=A0A4C1W393_EUMVA|nr:hypothetical protein EVAR_76083_1 [Eumeta japonica]
MGCSPKSPSLRPFPDYLDNPRPPLAHYNTSLARGQSPPPAQGSAYSRELFPLRKRIGVRRSGSSLRIRLVIFASSEACTCDHPHMRASVRTGFNFVTIPRQRLIRGKHRGVDHAAAWTALLPLQMAGPGRGDVVRHAAGRATVQHNETIALESCNALFNYK